jgi:hypothetical protein
MSDTSEELERALDKGSMAELPPNHPPGWLGEVAPNMRKADDFEPTLNAGVLQEDTVQTRWLLILVLYLLLLTSPLALWLLWREPRRSLRAKVVTTVLGVAGYAALYLVAYTLHPWA